MESVDTQNGNETLFAFMQKKKKQLETLENYINPFKIHLMSAL